eukprot:747673-Hanusia_phi.AAC.5
MQCISVLWYYTFQQQYNRYTIKNIFTKVGAVPQCHGPGHVSSVVKHVIDHSGSLVVRCCLCVGAPSGYTGPPRRAPDSFLSPPQIRVCGGDTGHGTKGSRRVAAAAAAAAAGHAVSG